ncbi:MAG: hypothetical protein GXY55_04010 [Phycisphaerae bacterium]|nr:hypothetical protein [Phycisphaerae bacterium]
MGCMNGGFRRGGRWRSGAMGLVLMMVLAGSAGLSCDSDAQTEFRQTATQAIGNGVKTIVNGILDGWIAAILDAGDGASSN